MTSSPISVDVLVIGAGPAGMVTTITLARYGVRVLLVEKRVEISTLSRALVVSTRSMEILRSWGLAEAVRAGSADVEPCGWVTRALTSGEGREFPLGYPTAAQAARLSPTRPAWVPQDHLEPVLLAHLRDDLGAEVRFGCELVDLRQDGGRVRAVLCEHAGGGRTREVAARFSVGADGAHSTVRDRLGLALEGSLVRGESYGVQFRAALAPYLTDRRYGLNVITNPAAGGVLTPRGADDRWHYGRERRPGRPGLVGCTPRRLADMIATAAGVPDLRPRIESVTAFSFTARIAERYRDGWVFLAGDAAHQMTPRGGTGMNTAIQDAYDLGWRLAWVLRGWAGERLLDGYESERRPVALHNVARSADPNGAERSADEAVPWDLNGRLPHHWLVRNGRRMSTLDLLGAGVTLLTGPDGPAGDTSAAVPGTRAPVTAHVLDQETARALDIPRGGALALRPDGKAAHRTG